MSDANETPYRRPAVTPVVQGLLIANIVIYLVQLFGVPLEVWFGLWSTDPVARGAPTFGIWQLLTYGFLHSRDTLLHIAFNMYMLWMFGSALEKLWGSGPFLRFYLVCVVGAGIVQTLVTAWMNTPGVTVGASGGVLGLLMAFGMMYPNNIIVLLIPPIPMKAKYFVVVLCVVELWLGLSVASSPIAHFAHVGGMLFGFLMITYWRGRLPLKPRRRLNR